MSPDESNEQEGRKSRGVTLDSLAEDFLAARRRGENLSVEDYARRHPDLADRIRELFPVLETLEAAGEHVAAPELPGRELGDYRILRELGRGGMGIVFEALQVSLDRRVALKVLPGHAHLDSRQLRRFRREARACARLRHPNIVPVFEVGEVGGMHFYAMQLIEGTGLDHVLEAARSRRSGGSTPIPEGDDTSALPARLADRMLTTGLATSGSGSGSASGTSTLPDERTSGVEEIVEDRYVANVARIGIQVARALAYAHEEGVLHRDLKPSNLLLDVHGTVWITDFGLAKTEGADTITDTGDVLGTPRYLAPESLRGWSDPRTDVWGVGVTLYELLVGRPAFSGTDRARLLRRIAEEEPTPPRRIEASIPHDLETVVLTAIEKEPRRRYSTAEDLADDLERFATGRPIRARRPTWWYRSRLLLRRHRIATSVAAAALVVLAAVVIVWAFTLSSALDREQEARGQAEAESLRAEENFRLALRAVDRMQGRLGAERLAVEPRLERLRREVLADAVGFYREFLARRADDPNVRYEAALSWARLGQAELLLDHPDEARSALREAEVLLRELARTPERLDARVELVGVLADIGRVRHAEGRFDEADRIADEVLDLASRVSTEAALDDSRIGSLVGAYEFAGRLRTGTLRLEEAATILGRGIALGTDHLERRSSDAEADSTIGYYLLSCLERRGEVYRMLGRFDEAEADLGHVRSILAPLVERDDVGYGTRFALARTDFGLAGVLSRTGRNAEAEEAYRNALAVCDRLAKDYPSIATYRALHAEIRVFLGTFLLETGRSEEAVEPLEGAIDEYDRLLADETASVERRRQLAVAWLSLGNLRWSRMRTADAEAAYRAAIERLEELRDELPAFDEYEDAVASLALAYGNLGSLLVRSGSPDEGEGRLLDSLALFQRLVERNPDRLGHREKLVLLGSALGLHLRRFDRLDEAEEIFVECCAVADVAVRRFGDVGVLPERRASAYQSLGNVLRRADRPEEAEERLTMSLTIRERLHKTDTTPPALSLLASSYNDLGVLYDATGRHEEAVRSLARSIAHEQEALDGSPGNTAYRHYMTLHHLNSSRALRELGRIEEAAEAARAAREFGPDDRRNLVYVAGSFCSCAVRAADDLAADLEEEAMDCLRRAVELGLDDAEELESNEQLAPLRDRPDFRALVDSLRE